jgi:RimJ/RimL family protein N-acetyltransferase
VNLLPEARGCGCATALLRRVLDRLRAAKVPGVHAQTLSLNEPVARFCRRAGFRIAARRALHAFAHVEVRPIEVCTWVRAL